MTFVSVIMPCYNSGQTMQRSVESVLGQTFDSLELLLLDDGSSDNTSDIALAFAKKDPRVRFISSEKNRGVIRMRNIGIRLAKGDWIAFCDSDDWWIPQKLELQLKIAAENPKANLLYSAVYYVRSNSQRKQLVQLIPNATYYDMLKTNAIPMSSSMYQIKTLGKRYFRPVPEHLIHEDYAFWLDLFRSGQIVSAYCSIPTTYIQLRPGSRSSNPWLAIRSHFAILKNENALPTWKTYWYLMLYIYIASRKRLLI